MLKVTRNHVFVTQKCAHTRLLTGRRRHICVERNIVVETEHKKLGNNYIDIQICPPM